MLAKRGRVATSIAKPMPTSAWDHVNECTIEVPPARVLIAGCTDYFPDTARIEPVPGSYRARPYYGSLSSLSEDCLDGDDYYRVVLWRAAPGPVRVLKKRGYQTGPPASPR
jgi:hypothetical protein